MEDAYQKAKDDFPDDEILKEKKIKDKRSNRIPDVQVIDPQQNLKKVIEVERHPKRKRNRNREKEYDDLEIPHETQPIPSCKPN